MRKCFLEASAYMIRKISYHLPNSEKDVAFSCPLFLAPLFVTYIGPALENVSAKKMISSPFHKWSGFLTHYFSIMTNCVCPMAAREDFGSWVFLFLSFCGIPRWSLAFPIVSLCPFLTYVPWISLLFPTIPLFKVCSWVFYCVHFCCG